jgi:hypothetical protein
VWTDARGYATVVLPPGAEPPAPPIDYALELVHGQTDVAVTADLQNGRFTLATEQPYVKVAWRLRGRRQPRGTDRGGRR